MEAWKHFRAILLLPSLVTVVVPATILLFTANTKTVSVAMFDLRESNDWGPIAVLSITMLVITFALVAAITWFTDRRLA